MNTETPPPAPSSPAESTGFLARRLQRIPRSILVLGGVLLAGILLFLFVLFPNVTHSHVIHVPEGADYGAVVDSLQHHGSLSVMAPFQLLAWTVGYPGAVRPGRYQLRKGMSALRVIILLRAGLQQPIQLTFISTRTRDRLALKIADRLDFSASELLATLEDSLLLDSLGFTPQNVMTMFIPNTYELYWDTSPREFVLRMHREYLRFWHRERRQKAAALELTPIEVSILASIVEAETNHVEERPRIAGVYLNRLDSRMKLQADPTVVFAVGDFSIRRVLYRHREVDSPYNTYMYEGLPPGPINTPSITSIDAVLNREAHNFYYFCAREDFSGYHVFATHYSQHQRNARRYQRALDRWMSSQ